MTDTNTSGADVLASLRGVLRIAKAASFGVTGNAPRIERAEFAIEAVAALIAERDALAAEVKALREANKVMRDALEWYAGEPSVWVSFAPDEYQKQFDAANNSPYLTRITDDRRGHPRFIPNECRAEEAIAAVDAIDAARASAATGEA